MALENLFWVFSFLLIWVIIRSAHLLCMVYAVVILLYQRLDAIFMSNYQFILLFYLNSWAPTPVILVRKLSYVIQNKLRAR